MIVMFELLSDGRVRVKLKEDYIICDSFHMALMIMIRGGKNNE